MYSFCFLLSSVSLAISIHFMPYLEMTSFWEFWDRLLPMRAPTRGFCLWVAMGQARVREKMSIMGRLRTWWVLGNSNLVYIKDFRSPVRWAKSWFFFKGSEPAPIICQPIMSLSSLSFSGLLKLLILVVLPKSLCDSEPIFCSILAILAKLLPFLSDSLRGVSYL